MLYDSSYILKRLNEKQEEDKHISSENDLLKAIKTINDSLIHLINQSDIL